MSLSNRASDQPVQTAGINDVYEYNEVHLSSFQRDSGDNDHPQWNLQPELHSVLGVKVLSAQIPYSFYTIVDSGSARNNVLNITQDAGLPAVITLPPGSYSANQLADALQDVANNAFHVPVLGVTWDIRNGKYTITNKLTSGGTRYLGLANNPLADVLGFPRSDIPFPTTSPYQLVAPYVANVAGPNSLYLVSRTLGGRLSRNVRCNGGSTANPPVVAKIPLNVNYGEVVNYTDPNPAPCFDTSMALFSTMDFELINADTLLPVELNGLSWSVSLQVLTQRDTSVTRSMGDQHTGSARKRLRS